MYRNYQMPNVTYYRNYGPVDQNQRFIAGGFAAPFLLGGLTGAVLTPYFNRPPYPMYPPYYQPYPPRPF